MSMLKLMLFCSFIILSKERLPILIEEMATELTVKLNKQEYPLNFAFTIQNRFVFTIKNIIPIFLFPKPYFKKEDIFFNDTIVTFRFDIWINFSTVKSRSYYHLNNNFAEFKQDLQFLHQSDNSYVYDYNSKPGTFKLSPITLQTIPQFKDAFIDSNPILIRKFGFNLEKFIDNQLLTYPLDDCAFRFKMILLLVIDSKRIRNVNIPLTQLLTITSMRINGIEYKSYKKELFKTCKIQNTAIALEYYTMASLETHKMTVLVENIYLAYSTVEFTGVDPSVPSALADYFLTTFNQHAQQCPM